MKKLFTLKIQIYIGYKWRHIAEPSSESRQYGSEKTELEEQSMNNAKHIYL